MLYLWLPPFPWLGLPELVKDVTGGTPLVCVSSGLFEPLLEFSPVAFQQKLSATREAEKDCQIRL